MVFAIILEVLVTAPLLMLALWVVMRKRGHYDFNRILAVTVALVGADILMSLALGNSMGLWILVPKFVVSVSAIFYFLFVPLPESIIVVILWELMVYGVGRLLMA